MDTWGEVSLEIGLDDQAGPISWPPRNPEINRLIPTYGMHKLNRISWPGNRKPQCKWRTIWLVFSISRNMSEATFEYVLNTCKMETIYKDLFKIFSFFHYNVVDSKFARIGNRADKKRSFQFFIKERIQHQIRDLPWRTCQSSAWIFNHQAENAVF